MFGRYRLQSQLHVHGRYHLQASKGIVAYVGGCSVTVWIKLSIKDTNKRLFWEQRPCSPKITVVYMRLNTGIVTLCIQFDDKLSVSNQLIQK